MKLYKQINNLKIYNLNTGGWIVKEPINGKLLEQFAMRHEAENWCKNTKDFLAKNIYKSIK